jgi:CIC family chloride channel protein
VGSGNVGGLFAPSLVIGAMLGGAFGAGTETWLRPGEAGTVTVYALVGMGALVAGTTHATITAILLVFELTNDYAIILPAMLTAATSVLLSSRLSRESIYTLKLVRSGIHLERGVEVNVMSSIPVSRVMREPRSTVPRNMHFTELLDRVEESIDNTFPVLDEENRLVGVISYQDIRNVLRTERSPEMDLLIVASDIATQDPIVVMPEQSLNDAMRLFGTRDLSLLPVVDSVARMRLLGVLYRRDVLNAYGRALLERQVPEL